MSYFDVGRFTRVHWFNQLGDADAARFVCALESVRQLDWLHITRNSNRRLVLHIRAPVSARGLREIEFGDPEEDIPTAMRALNLDLSRAIFQRLQTRPMFRACILCETVRAMLDDNVQLTKGLLRRVIDATMGYEELAVRMDGHPKSLVRMLSPSGNPSATHLVGILTRVARANKVSFTVQLSERVDCWPAAVAVRDAE